MNPDLRKKLEKMHYGLVGESAAVQICLWTKKALKGEGVCWKEKFYGVSSAGCCQMTPNVMNCENMCLHCWRPIEHNLGINISKSQLKPEELLNKIIEKRKFLLNGFLGNKKIKKELYFESLEPRLYTLSLSGEPTLYPYLGELFTLIRKKRKISFLVTNGQNPQAIKELEKKGLPTQLVVSTNAPNKELFEKWHRSCKKDSFKSFLETLDILKELKGKTRRVIRLTLVKEGKGETKEHNDLTNMSKNNLIEYASIIKRAEPDFIHVKGFKSVGYARTRLGYDKQPWFNEIKDYSKELLKLLNNEYEIKGEHENSSVVLIAKKGLELKIKKV
jgi:tRNA wybutosine-synthesizing protein 1